MAESGSENRSPKNKAGKMDQFFASKGLRPAVEDVFGKEETLKMLENKKGRCIIAIINAVQKDGTGHPISGYTAQTFSRQALGVVDTKAPPKNMGSKMGQFLSAKTLEVAVRAVFKDSIFQKTGKNKKSVLLPSVQAKSQGVRNASIITGYTATTFSQLCDVMAIADNLGQPEKRSPYPW